jgi:glycosyltransferase involved in cell wall biosynthesis
MATVAVDARELAGRPTGVGRYLLELLRNWSSSEVSHSFILYSHEPLGPGTPFADRAIVLEGTGGTRWEQTTFARALRRDAPDVLFAPAATAPLTIDVPIALTIHDLSYVAHPEWFRLREGLRRRLLTRASARKAAVILTGSAFSAGEIVERLGVPASKVRMVYHGVSVGSQSSSQTSREALILFVGSLFNRRHVPDLVHAFAHVVRQIRQARLVIVGDNRTYPREDPREVADSLNVSSRVEVLDYAPNAEIEVLYRRASVFVFVSEYEGFGLTPLEALAYGVPIVVADTPLSREIYGDAAVTVPIGDAHTLGKTILTLLQDEDRRLAALAAAPDVLARYAWNQAAVETLEAIERAAARPPRVEPVEG